jgi:hypothetical protein
MDYATGLLIEAVANGRYAADISSSSRKTTFRMAPRGLAPRPAFVVGPYVKQGGVVVSTPYSQVSALRTIEDLLGTEHLA